MLANDDAKGLVLTLWASEEGAARRDGFDPVSRFVTLLAAPAGRGYDVVRRLAGVGG